MSTEPKRYEAYKIWGEQGAIIVAKDAEIADLRRRLELAAIYDGDKDRHIEQFSKDYFGLRQKVNEFQKWLFAGEAYSTFETRQKFEYLFIKKKTVVPEVTPEKKGEP